MSTDEPQKRRSNHAEMPLAYAAIGASDSPDLLRFPPEGSTPYEEVLQLGSGVDRFHTAANLLMTWGAQRIAGVEVSDVQQGPALEYAGVQFTEGVPEVGPDPEYLFTTEGDPYILAGTAATFSVAGGEPRRIMVVSTVVEPRRLGFTWGDRDEVSGCGEQLITVEHRADGTVWAVARGFAFMQASGLLAGRKQRSELRDVVEQAQAFIAALAPGAAIRTGVVKPAGEGSDAELEAGAEGDATDEAVVTGETEANASESATTDPETA